MSAADVTATLSPSALRIYSLLREVLEILVEHPDGLRVQDLFKSLKERMPPTEAELEVNGSGVLRYDTNVRWWSVGLVKAEFVVKAKGVWRVTDEGRRALSQFPDGNSFGLEVERKYREWSDARAVTESGIVPGSGVVDAILVRIPPGQWVTAGDLGKVANTSGPGVGMHMWRDTPPGWHKVLRRSGRPSAEVYDDQERLAQQRALLAAEGIVAEPRAAQAQRISLVDLEAIAAEVRGAPGAWLIRGTSVRGSSIIPTWLAEGFVSLPASQLPPIDLDGSDEDIRSAVERGYDGLGYSQRTAKFGEVRMFLRRIKPGHLVITSEDSDVFLGQVTGPCEQVESPGRRSNLRRSVEWSNADEPVDQDDISARLAGRLRTQADIVDLSDVYDDVAALLDRGLELDEDEDGAPDTVAEVVLPTLDEGRKSELLIDARWLDEFVELLRAKRQVILYGPPGTGKTFLAQEVAEGLGGPERVTLVQFHPSYAYEDFFEGYRPAGTGDGGVSLQLVPGPFRKVVDLARANPTEPFFLIIDEINRANLAKVFGELYFLLEYRDRSIDLLYSSGDSGPAFSLPANVYIIGTMNTADRSIALVDAAMRRRFAFLSLHPEDERLDLVLRQWLALRGLPGDRADLFVELNRRIANKDFKIGPSYLMTTSIADEAGLDRIWRTSILPLLEEYHVGDSVDVKAKYGLSSLRRALQAPDVGD